jgi:FAD/FMN-containing dehydrogenase
VIPVTDWKRLASDLDGELYFDQTMRVLYATDASVYRELPQAVALPKNEEDIRKLIKFAQGHGTALIPRTAGTSLAGQVVGSGIVVDVSRHLNRILEIDAAQRRVRVQPGIVRNELNLALASYGLFFAPETSTQNRAMIGGMIGNNSCGANSVIYGTTRDHLISARAILSDGSVAEFGPVHGVTRKLGDQRGSGTKDATFRTAHILTIDKEIRVALRLLDKSFINSAQHSQGTTDSMRRRVFLPLWHIYNAI